MAIEDRRFRSHWGVDPRGIARAAWHNLWSSGSSQGGSTITQQLAKGVFLSADRTFGRKAREALIAFWLEAWLTKDQIKIGRAVCRERVCQYESISVVAVSIKKNKIKQSKTITE